MARNYATIATIIWRNKDFLALTERAQRMYLMLTSQPEISAAGVLPLSVTRWAGRAEDSTRESVVSALQELQERRFIVYDTGTEELLVRSFVRWDGGFGNPKRRPVIARAAGDVESPVIRRSLAMEFQRLGLPAEWVLDWQADSLSATESTGTRGHPELPPGDATPDPLFSQVNSLSGSESPSDGVVVTQGLLVDPATHNPQPPSTTKAKRSNHGTRLPEDWEHDADLAAWAKEKYPAVDLDEATMKFKNYWLSKTGKDATKKDWHRTWQNWVAEESRRLQRFAPMNTPYRQQADSNAPKAIPADDRCPKHRGQRAGRCGPCRSEAHGVRQLA